MLLPAGLVVLGWFLWENEDLETQQENAPTTVERMASQDESEEAPRPVDLPLYPLPEVPKSFINRVASDEPAEPEPISRPEVIESPSLPPEQLAIFETQLALDRLGISPGPLDGKMGHQTRVALMAFQFHNQLEVSGAIDEATRRALDVPERELFRKYVITASDLDRIGTVSASWLGKSEQDRLPYESLLELVAEKGHAYQSFIQQLNPGVDWSSVSAGVTVFIPNVKSPPVTIRASLIRIKLQDKVLLALGTEGELLAHYPCSIGRDVEKRPVGVLHVTEAAADPTYRFDPDIFPESAEGRRLGRVLTIPPGPNNPVGTAWIGLDKPGYGIHGTPDPEKVGRTESHGCFRLANWNAEHLIQLVRIGIPVFVEP